MDLFFKVQEVINKDLLKKSIPLCWLALVNLFLWGSLDSYGKYIPIIVIFSYMVVEDYLNREIDLRLVGLIFVLFLFCVPSLELFLKNLFIGTLIFLNFFFMACRPQKKFIVESNRELEDGELELGFLPSFGLAVLIFCVTEKYDLLSILIPKWDDTSSKLFLIISAILFVFFTGRYYQMKTKEKKGDLIIEEGFGLGDFFVCALGYGFWGTEFLIIIFMAFLIQIGAYKYETIKTKDELNGT